MIIEFLNYVIVINKKKPDFRQPTLCRLSDEARLCPECGIIVPPTSSDCKLRHFRERHPQYKFNVEYSEKHHSRTAISMRYFRCLGCGKIASSYRDLVEHHNH